jgi:hypothetical protein
VKASYRSTLRLPSTNQAAGNSIVVSPTTQPTASDQSANSVTVITADQIESQQFRTVLNALATVPGLNVVQRGQTSVFIRSTNYDQVKVLIDGSDVSDPRNPNGSSRGWLRCPDDTRRIQDSLDHRNEPKRYAAGSESLAGRIDHFRACVRRAQPQYPARPPVAKLARWAFGRLEQWLTIAREFASGRSTHAAERQQA